MTPRSAGAYLAFVRPAQGPTIVGRLWRFLRRSPKPVIYCGVPDWGFPHSQAVCTRRKGHPGPHSRLTIRLRADTGRHGPVRLWWT